MPASILPFAAITTNDLESVGGKGLSLGLLIQAGIPVPDGFCVTTHAYRQASATRIDDPLWDDIRAAYLAMGAGCVAVRSSATAEDGHEASFAGQQETILGVEGEPALREAIERCWSSLHSERAKAYRTKQGVEEDGLAMAVVVQRLIDADVAGVLFTRDPFDASGSSMRVEASWGLGEAVVSGRVTPDRFQVDRTSGAPREQQAGHKNIRITRHGEETVGASLQSALCLNDAELRDLAALGRAVEAFYGEARDIEWGIAQGQLWLLQARPITTTSAADREALRSAVIQQLQSLASTPTVWSRTNLIEVLPQPTPLTWAIVTQHLLSGGGGTGLMYQDFGFKPDPALASTSAYDLIGGSPYMNLAREPRLQAAKPLFGYPLEAYRANPAAALEPKPDTTRVLGGFGKWFRMFGMVFIAGKIASASKTFANEFRQTIIPAFIADVERANERDLAALTPQELLAYLHEWTRRTLHEFARHSLKPTLLAEFAWQVLEKQLAKTVDPARAKSLVTTLSQGAKIDEGANLPQAIRALAAGTLDRSTFLKQFGHRGANEMELSAPRWAEDPSTLPQQTSSTIAPPPNETTFEGVAAEAKWNRMLAQSMAGHAERMQTYLGLRETGKHFLMRGYAHLRQIVLEFDRRYELHGGVFELTPDELPDLIAGKNVRARLAERRQRRMLERTLEVPAVLFSDQLDVIGRPMPVPQGATQWQGVPLSAGMVEGKALVLHEPKHDLREPGYILVCPSTDPAWVPLFIQARGLVMEAGGTLSHGAIVAREFGLPAVAGLLNVHRQLTTGQRIRVDGTRGTVTVLDEQREEKP